jgi:hypothetical protein
LDERGADEIDDVDTERIGDALDGGEGGHLAAHLNVLPGAVGDAGFAVGAAPVRPAFGAKPRDERLVDGG